MELDDKAMEMARQLIANGSHTAVLTSSSPMGWPDGLAVPMNGADDEDMLDVAHLDLEDSEHGPRLWDFAITVLKQVYAQEKSK